MQLSHERHILRRYLRHVPAASVLFFAVGLGCEATASQRYSKLVRIISPKNDSQVEAGVDPRCTYEPSCSKIAVSGTVPVEYQPVLGVASLIEPTVIRIQAEVRGKRADGSFIAYVELDGNDGWGVRYHLFLFACLETRGLRQYSVIASPPPECLQGEPVTVMRVR